MVAAPKLTATLPMPGNADTAFSTVIAQSAQSSPSMSNTSVVSSPFWNPARYPCASIDETSALRSSRSGKNTIRALPAAAEGDELVADYAALGFTLGRHPLALLRERLAGLRFVPADELNAYPDRKLARGAGLVTCRQRPSTAKGTMFVTLEDESGLVNVVVHEALVGRQRRELLGARLLGVFGQIRREGRVVHLVASRVVDHSALLGRLVARARNFH